MIHRFHQRGGAFERGNVVAFKNGFGQHVDQPVSVRVCVVDFKINPSNFFYCVYATNQQKRVWNQWFVQNGMYGIVVMIVIGFYVFNNNMILYIEVVVFF
jgi:hypothetical protein